MQVNCFLISNTIVLCLTTIPKKIKEVFVDKKNKSIHIEMMIIYQFFIRNLSGSNYIRIHMLCVFLIFMIIGLLEGEARLSGEMKDVTIQRGGSCNNDNTCHDTCPGCRVTQCSFSQCVCSRCNTPQTSLRVKSHM